MLTLGHLLQVEVIPGLFQQHNHSTFGAPPLVLFHHRSPITILPSLLSHSHLPIAALLSPFSNRRSPITALPSPHQFTMATLPTDQPLHYTCYIGQEEEEEKKKEEEEKRGFSFCVVFLCLYFNDAWSQ